MCTHGGGGYNDNDNDNDSGNGGGGGTNNRMIGRKCHCCILGGVIDPDQEEAYKQWTIDNDDDLITIVQQDEVCVKGEVSDIQRFQTLQSQTKRIRFVFLGLAWITSILSIWVIISFLYLYGSITFLQNGMDTLKVNMDVTMDALDNVIQERQVVEPIISDLTTIMESEDIQLCLVGDLIQNAEDDFVSSLEAWNDDYMEPQIMLNLTESLEDGTGKEDHLYLFIRTMD